MKQFNLKKYLANTNRREVTRDGSPAMIICTYRKVSNQPILALVQVRADPMEVALTFSTGGKYDIGRETKYDLFFASEKHEGWVNIIRDMVHNEVYCGNMIYASKEEAERIANNATLATAKIEWEE